MANHSLAAAWALALSFAAVTPSASAAEPIEEVAHEIAVDLGERRATLVVRRTVRTSFVDEHEAHFSIKSSPWTVGAGLRTRGDDGRWYRGDVLPVAAAIQTYWTLTGSLKVVPERGGGPRSPSLSPKDPALMMWSPEGFEVYVFPVVQGRPKAIEYTLAVPYAYEGGAYTFEVPVGGEHELAPELRIGAVPRNHRVFVGDAEVRPGSVVAATTTGMQRVRLVPPSRPALALRVASTAAGERHLARVEVEAGPLLGPDPKDTHVVIVLDRSRSMTDSGADAARRAALDYLAHLGRVPGARAAIVAFDRAVVRLHEGFLSPAAAADVLRAAPTARANGSDLAGALAAAATALKAARGAAPRRVLVLSDTAIEPAAEAAVVRLLADSRALVHVADLQGGRYSRLDVDEGHRWRELVVATGGLVWRGEVDVRAAGVDSVFSEWVRPGAVRGLMIERDGLPLAEIELSQGEGMMQVDVLERAPRGVRATGRVWGRTITAEGRRSAADDREWTLLAAAYVDELTDAEIVDVATRAGAASPRTALLALEPGARPGQAAPPSVPQPIARSSNCRFGIGGQGGFGRYSLEFDEGAFVRQAVADAASTCRARHRDVEVELTTTYAEVVAIDRVEVPDDPAAAACIRDRLWELEFPPGRDVVAEHVVELDAAGR